MKLDKFEEFWTKWSSEWYENAKYHNDAGIECPVREICEIKEGYHKELFDRYEKIKAVTKKAYFSDDTKRLNRYKRAAVLAYAINGASPLLYKCLANREYIIDHFFLKQRLAIHVALGSIMQEYPYELVREHLSRGEIIFSFPQLTTAEESVGADTFELGMYKDLFFADLYHNYNVLTLANVFWLLTEKASFLGKIDPLP